MASKSRPKPKAKGKVSDLSQFGLLGIPDFDAMDPEDDDSDCDDNTLESELAALMSGVEPPKRKKAKAVGPAVNIEKMAAECLADPDEEDDDDDTNLSNDEDLLNELRTLTIGQSSEPESSVNLSSAEEKSEDKDSVPNATVTILKERLLLYSEALEAAKKLNESSKIRRYTRAIETLKSQIKSSERGVAISEEDIPPVVKIPKATDKEPHPVPSAAMPRETVYIPPPSKPDSKGKPEDAPITKELESRRDDYKRAALEAKKDGNKESALTYMKCMKVLNSGIQTIKDGESVDMSTLPPPLNEFQVISTAPKAFPQSVNQEAAQTSSEFEAAAIAAAEESDSADVFAAPPPPSTILEALNQRLQKYSETRQAAVAEGNNSKARRLDRILKQYAVAIKNHNDGKKVEYQELPCPPGFGPIPVPSEPPASASRSAENVQKPKEQVAPPLPPRRTGQPVAGKTTSPPKPQLQRSATIADKTLDFLLERQKQFRQAALEAKKNGDIQLAKEYLRMSKGFDSMIEATKCGLPIDASSIPTPPQLSAQYQLESEFVIVDKDCIETGNLSHDELLENLYHDLHHQIELALLNKNNYLRLGDVSSASKFERLLLESKKDLSVLEYSQRTGGQIPKFHYETRLLSIVQCNIDLTDDELEVIVKRGIDLPGKPNELDSYVKLEFPLPSNSPQTAKTSTVYNTQNPEFEAAMKFAFSRKSRVTQRAFKRQALKLEVWSKGGFLRSDSLLGVVSAKLSDFESKCIVHESYDLMSGRKSAGGKLEVKMRMKEPLLVKQVEEVREKWLVIGT